MLATGLQASVTTGCHTDVLTPCIHKPRPSVGVSFIPKHITHPDDGLDPAAHQDHPESTCGHCTRVLMMVLILRLTRIILCQHVDTAPGPALATMQSNIYLRAAINNVLMSVASVLFTVSYWT